MKRSITAEGRDGRGHAGGIDGSARNRSGHCVEGQKNEFSRTTGYLPPHSLISSSCVGRNPPRHSLPEGDCNPLGRPFDPPLLKSNGTSRQAHNWERNKHKRSERS